MFKSHGSLKTDAKSIKHFPLMCFLLSPLGASKVPLPFLLRDVLVCLGEIPLLHDQCFPPHPWVPKILPWYRWDEHKNTLLSSLFSYSHRHRKKNVHKWHIIIGVNFLPLHPIFRTDPGWRRNKWSHWEWQLQWRWEWSWKWRGQVEWRRSQRRWGSPGYQTWTCVDPVWVGGTVEPLREAGGASCKQKVCPCRYQECCRPARGHEGGWGFLVHFIRELTLATLHSNRYWLTNKRHATIAFMMLLHVNYVHMYYI